MNIVMDTGALHQLLNDVFEQVAGEYEIEEITPEGVRVRLNVGHKHLRPGGTISGPSMFGLADVAVYLAVLSRIGPEALAVTTNSSFDFMRKPDGDRDMIADCRLLKLGRVLAVGDVLLYSEGQEAPVARATLTYSIPPK